MEKVACDFRADVGFNAEFIRGQVKTRSAVDAIGVEEGHGRKIEPRADSCHILGQRRAFEEAESGAGVKFGVHQWSVASGQSNQICWPLTTGH